jgi:hypothetical protein
MSSRRAKHASSRINRKAFTRKQPREWELSKKLRNGRITSANGAPIRDSIDLSKPEYVDVLTGIPEDRRPKVLRVHRIDPGVLRDLGRTERLVLLKRLSKKKVFIQVSVRETTTKDKRKDTVQGCYRLTPKDGVEVDLATVLILSIALRERRICY